MFQCFVRGAPKLLRRVGHSAEWGLPLLVSSPTAEASGGEVVSKAGAARECFYPFLGLLGNVPGLRRVLGRVPWVQARRFARAPESNLYRPLVSRLRVAHPNPNEE